MNWPAAIVKTLTSIYKSRDDKYVYSMVCGHLSQLSKFNVSCWESYLDRIVRILHIFKRC